MNRHYIYIQKCLTQKACSTNVSYIYYFPGWLLFCHLLDFSIWFCLKVSAWYKQSCGVLKDLCDGSMWQGEVNLTDTSSCCNSLLWGPIMEVLGDIVLRKMAFPTLERRQSCLCLWGSPQALWHILLHLLFLYLEYPLLPCLPGNPLHILLDSAQVTFSGTLSLSPICLPRQN